MKHREKEDRLLTTSTLEKAVAVALAMFLILDSIIGFVVMVKWIFKYF